MRPLPLSIDFRNFFSNFFFFLHSEQLIVNAFVAMPTSLFVLVMGVTACGKSTTAAALADQLRAERQELLVQVIDADDFHSEKNREKMSRGVSLTDEDRWPWLQSIATFTDTLFQSEVGPDVIVCACSALKKRYRDVLIGSVRHKAMIVHLVVDADTATRRAQTRTGHFASPHIITAQFAALEMPTAVEAETVVECQATDHATLPMVSSCVQRFCERRASTIQSVGDVNPTSVRGTPQRILYIGVCLDAIDDPSFHSLKFSALTSLACTDVVALFFMRDGVYAGSTTCPLRRVHSDDFVDARVLQSLVATSFVPLNWTTLCVGAHGTGATLEVGRLRLSDGIISGTDDDSPARVHIATFVQWIAPQVFAQCGKREQYAAVVLDACLLANIAVAAAAAEVSPYVVASEGFMWEEDADCVKHITSPMCVQLLSQHCEDARELQRTLVDVCRHYVTTSVRGDAAVINTSTACELYAHLTSHPSLHDVGVACRSLLRPEDRSDVDDVVDLGELVQQLWEENDKSSVASDILYTLLKEAVVYHVGPLQEMDPITGAQLYDHGASFTGLSWSRRVKEVVKTAAL